MKRTFGIALMLILTTVFSIKANPVQNYYLNVKIFSKDSVIDYSNRGLYVVHFRMENCGNKNIPIDFYGNIGYPTDQACNIYFSVYRADRRNGVYKPYNFQMVDYANNVDSMITLYPRRIYNFFLPLLDVYEINDPGYYRLQGFYRFKTEDGTAYKQASNYLYFQLR